MEILVVLSVLGLVALIAGADEVVASSNSGLTPDDPDDPSDSGRPDSSGAPVAVGQSQNLTAAFNLYATSADTVLTEVEYDELLDAFLEEETGVANQQGDLDESGLEPDTSFAEIVGEGSEPTEDAGDEIALAGVDDVVEYGSDDLIPTGNEAEFIADPSAGSPPVISQANDVLVDWALTDLPGTIGTPGHSVAGDGLTADGIAQSEKGTANSTTEIADELGDVPVVVSAYDPATETLSLEFDKSAFPTLTEDDLSAEILTDAVRLMIAEHPIVVLQGTTTWDPSKISVAMF